MFWIYLIPWITLCIGFIMGNVYASMVIYSRLQRSVDRHSALCLLIMEDFKEKGRTL